MTGRTFLRLQAASFAATELIAQIAEAGAGPCVDRVLDHLLAGKVGLPLLDLTDGLRAAPAATPPRGTPPPSTGHGTSTSTSSATPRPPS